jgi:2,3-bisphosphoglycerate-dependent phosphoglycerate mutase
MARHIAALIRHGDYRQLPDTPSAHQPFPLTPEGEAQAHRAVPGLLEDIAANGWTLDAHIDSSRMLRAWQTARIIAEGMAPHLPTKPEVVSFDSLAERGLGSAANLSMRQIADILDCDPRFETPPGDWKSNSRYCLPLQGAESLMDAGARVAAHLNRRMGALRDSAVDGTLALFVGHGAAFRHAAHHLGILSFDQIAELSMYHVRPVYLECLTDGCWRQVGGEWKVRASAGDSLD